jgi:hypothetical protein
LSYCDAASGKSVLLAEVKECVGTVDGNQVIYEDAFTDFKADVRYTYSRGGFEQDVILRERPPAPSEFGLDPRTTRLQVYTEFLAPPQPVIRLEPVGRAAGTEAVDEEVDFGAMRIGRGKAFRWHRGGREEAVPVPKAFRKLEGRDFLIEEVPLPAVAEGLEALPAPEGAALPRATKAGQRTASLRRPLPPAPPRARSASEPPMLAARWTPPAAGFVLDYHFELKGDTNDVTFQGDTTYFVTGPYTVNGILTIEGGAVIKYTNNAAVYAGAKVQAYGGVVCQTAPYRMAVFTSQDDDTVGETLPGSTGNPTLWRSLDLFTVGHQTLRGLRFMHAYCAVLSGSGVTVEDCQFVKCGGAFDLYWRPITLRNVLFSQVSFVLNGSVSLIEVTAENVTADGFQNFAYMNTSLGASLAACNLTNCLLTRGTNWVVNQSNPPLATNAVVWQPDATGLYQAAAGGHYYLADGSPYRNAGVTNVSTNVLALLQARTTYPPIVLSDVTLAADTTLNPQAQRDTDTPDLGYHYAPLDYVFAGVTAESNLTFTAGTAAGWHRTSSGWYHAGHGIHLRDNTRATFDGTATAPTYWVRGNTVQEQDLTGGYGPGGITGWTYPSVAEAPQIQARFLRCSALANEPPHFRDDWGILVVQATHCEFWGGQMGGYDSLHSYTNCLFDRVAVWHATADSEYPVFYLRNCTVRGGSLTFAHWEAPPYWFTSIRDCAFDGTAISTGDPSGGDPAVVDYDYNAFLTGADRTGPQGTYDVLVTNRFDWQHSALGSFYLPTNSPLVNAGSVTNAAERGLYHFTTQTNQVKEANTRLDIGFHYVACDTNGVPVDTDGDGLADYEDEDSDGDGLPDAWELKHFGDLSQSAYDDYDSDGIYNLDEFNEESDPNTITFATHFENLYVSTRTVTGSCEVMGGVPAQTAVLVNSTNLSTSTWSAYSPSFTVTLPDTDGDHIVLVALRGRTAEFPAATDETELTLDRVALTLCITNPATPTVIKPYLQLQGCADEALASLSYDLTNALGQVTNELVAVVDQYFDTNRFDFTTNYFQGYDIPLTNGVNAITLRVCDLAGNVTTTNFSVTLDYTTATNPPVMQCLWPTNGMSLSGTSFYLLGTINDETATITARIVDASGYTNEFTGLVERNGMFWVENLPLAAGTNVIHLAATNAAGRGSLLNLAVVQSSVALAMTSTPEGDSLYEPTGSVSGTVSDPSYTVSVNGLVATVDASGHWEASGVPIYGQGTATFDAVATPPTGSSAQAVGASKEEELPAKVMIVKHLFRMTSTTPGHSYSYADIKKQFGARAKRDADTGQWQAKYQGLATLYQEGQNSVPPPFVPPWEFKLCTWSDTDPLGTYALTYQDSMGNRGGNSGTDVGEPIRTVPHRSYDNTSGTYVYHYFGKGVHWTQTEGPSILNVVTFKTARTRQRLYTGGKAGRAIRNNLFTLSASATEYGKPRAVWPFPGEWQDTPGTTVPPNRISVGGWPASDEYKVWRVLADNTTEDVTVTAKGAKHYQADVTVQKHGLVLVKPSGNPTNAPSDPDRLSYNDERLGVLELNLTAVLTNNGPAWVLTNRVRFEADEIPDSTQGWSTNNPNGRPIANGSELSATLYYANLPPTNSAFGLKFARVTLDGKVSDDKCFWVFYQADAKNYPGCGDPDDDRTPPNYFYYYLQTSANCGSPDYGPDYAYGGHSAAKLPWEQAGPAYRYQIEAKGGRLGYDPVFGVNGGKNYQYINVFGYARRHEGAHATNYNTWWPSGYISGRDPDQDAIPTSIEIAAGLVPTNRVSKPNPGIPNWDDGQWYTLLHEPEWGVNQADQEDWAHPGANYP